MNGSRIALLILTLGWSLSALAIINGAPVDRGDYEEVLNLKSELGDVCTAVLIGPRVVATNAHCLRNSPTATVTAVNGEQAVATFTKSPLYPDRNHDLALGYLPYELYGIEPGVIATQPAAVGDALMLVGYGCIAVTKPADGILRAGESVVQGFETLQFRTGGAATALACYGDSGAPGYTDNGDAIAGLITQGNLETVNYLVRFDTAESLQMMKSFTTANNLTICGFNADCDDRLKR